MTKEDKELLLKDLCARLPYEVIVKDRNGTHKLTAGNTEFTDLLYNGKCNIKPYLFPLSSMTGAHRAELFNLRIPIEHPFQDTLCEIDFYHRYHFDYRGLIPKGLALDATGLNVY